MLRLYGEGSWIEGQKPAFQEKSGFSGCVGNLKINWIGAIILIECCKIVLQIIFEKHAAKQKMKKNWFVVLLLILQACQFNPIASQTAAPEPVGNATQPVVPTTPTAAALIAQTPTQAPESTARSVVLISWDGSPAERVYGLMADGQMPNFAALAAQGIRAEYAQSIDPSLTAAAHNSISSGAFPTRTGITSNSFHVAGDDFFWYRRGFDETMQAAEPIWVTASRHGLTTAAVFFVGGSPAHSGQEADYTIGYGVNDAYSTQRQVELSPAEGWQAVPASFSPALEGSFTIQDVGKVFLYVVDDTDDAVQNYDTVLVNSERTGSDPAQLLHAGEWGPLVLLKRAYAGADFLIQEIQAEQVTLYHSGVNHNSASPTELLQALNQKFGFFPSGGDAYALEHGWISAEDFMLQLEKQSTYMAQVAAWVYTTYQPDLLATWQDPFDSAGHQFSLLDERQLNYSPELAEQYAGYYRQAARAADQSLGILLEAIDLDSTTLMMVGDHGMAPIHSVVYVNTILEQAGLLTLDSQNTGVLNKTQAFAIASGGAVHVYINREGREKGGGVVAENDYAAVQAQIKQLLVELKDPETGEAVFQRVLLHEELAPLGLDHPNSGDVFAQAYPGYHLDGWRGNDFVFEQADFYGQHGYDSSLPEMHTIFIAAGAGVAQNGAVIPPVRIIEYAPTIAGLLGFAAAPGVDGTPIQAMVSP